MCGIPSGSNTIHSKHFKQLGVIEMHHQNLRGVKNYFPKPGGKSVFKENLWGVSDIYPKLLLSHHLFSCFGNWMDLRNERCYQAMDGSNLHKLRFDLSRPRWDKQPDQSLYIRSAASSDLDLLPLGKDSGILEIYKMNMGNVADPLYSLASFIRCFIFLASNL